MKKTLQRGFTLIELLVVIAIIGILAAVVLASLNDARDGGQDASIKQSLGNARSQAELVYNAAGTNQFSYTDVCLATTEPINNLMQAAADNRAETTDANVFNGTADQTDAAVHCNSDEAEYAISAPLNIFVQTGTPPTDTQAYWCIDSNGGVGVTTTALPTGDTECTYTP